MTTSKRLLLFFFATGSILYSLFSLYKIIKSFAGDFSVYYHAGLSLIQGGNIYHLTSFTIFNYPPLTALAYVPLSFLPYQIAQAIYILTSFISACVCVVICFKLLKQKFSFFSYLFVTALFLLSFPTKFTLGMGQSNLIAYLLLLLTVWLTRKNKTIFAGILLACAIILKPIFVFFVLFFLLQKSWKTIASCVLTGSSVLLLQFLLFRQTESAWQTYFISILPSLFTSKGREVYYNQGLLGTISRLTPNDVVRKFGTWILSLVLLLDVGKNIFKTKHNSNLQLALFMCFLPLIDSLSWQHHFVILLFPMMVGFYQLRKTKIGLGFLVISYVLISSNIKDPQQLHFFGAPIILSHVFWGTLLLLCLLLYCARLPQAQTKHTPSS